MKYDNQLRYAVNIVKDYDGRFPLAGWLKDFFREHKQMGSRDRKTVAEMVYGFYRLGHAQFQSIEERMLTAIFAGNHLPEAAAYFKSRILSSDPAYSHLTRAGAFASESTREGSGDQKHLFPAPQEIFPWMHQLSNGIDKEAFARSFLSQPDLFLRIRPGKENAVPGKLNAAGVDYRQCDDSCIALPNTTKVDAILELNKEVVIQDKSSQRTGAFLKSRDGASSTTMVWDCCAASGGKAIMAYDLLPGIDLTVSDLRPSIINNLKERFQQAGIQNYRSFVADLTDSRSMLPDNKYDLIIADVPCSGSGTWARTPEQLYFFKEEKINYYRQLQQKIVTRVIPSLKQGGALLYITCSVFAKENEEVVDFILANYPLRVTQMELITGYQEKADTMFAAMFTSR